MSIKVDHTPYLLPGDLRTAEDVLAWMRNEEAEWRAAATSDAGVPHGASLVRFDGAAIGMLDGIAKHLESRLDRERRKACRRGTLEEWRRMSSLVVNGDVSSDGMDSFAYAIDGGEGAIIVLASDHLARALAFRAAARER